jgi:uncharacterized protein
MPAPLVISNIDFARKALEVHGRIPVSQFPRLPDLLASQDGELEYVLLGNVDSNNRPSLRLQVQGKVQLQCQRCLESFEFELEIDSVFIIAADESAIPDLPEDDDVLPDEDYVIADTQMRVADLIEDEILLALPYAPKHEAVQCNVDGKADAMKRPSPFAVLEKLKMNMPATDNGQDRNKS